MDRIEQHLKSLEYFKDWSNYLLVSTVAALGWVASKDGRVMHADIEIWCFALSIVFGIFTLALVPIVAAQVNASIDSFYDVRPRFRPFWLWGEEITLPIKAVCWPQHIFFLIGILAYAKHAV
ncbi:hypothetical protein JWZ98_06940 [Methylomonas sp. EFPC1]|uniref:hypothetical protein n=1 Tax=Methylomonas sp. EFPC1 TaxID=2812647 RepID=UPI0019670BC9|nr:hypothetical protein [Methylomonas sp. EFPC1]QSB02666.1 hypothetical protein JWZ98_06940 [Methylomonas sp. EFPC1]